MYEFVLKFRLPDAEANPADYLDALYEAGCDDATVGVGKRGFIALDFSREAPSAEMAVRSALDAVMRAIPGAEAVEIGPDLVNLTDVADVLGYTRQNVQKYAVSEARAPFPSPVHTGPNLYHLAEVLAWFEENTSTQTQQPVVELALVAFQENLDIQQRRYGRVRMAV